LAGEIDESLRLNIVEYISTLKSGKYQKKQALNAQDSLLSLKIKEYVTYFIQYGANELCELAELIFTNINYLTIEDYKNIFSLS
jgi:hypothetical protein